MVTSHDHVKSLLYSTKPGEDEFLDGFNLNLKEGSPKTKPESTAEDYRKENKIEWSYHDWSSGDVRVGVPQEEREGGKKRKSDEEGKGNSEKKRKVGVVWSDCDAE